MPYFIDDFEIIVQNYPNNIAIKTHTDAISYATVNKRANWLAKQLHDKGIKPDQTIGILLDRSANMIIAMLAAWKIGAGFLLIDATNTKDRASTKTVLDDCDITTLLTNKNFSDPLFLQKKEKNEQRKLLRISNDTIIKETDENPDRKTLPDNPLAYVITTSGTTGKPKVIQIEHTKSDTSDVGLNGFFHGMKDTMDLKPGEFSLWDSPLTFDPTIAIFGWAFVSGGGLYIPSNVELRDRRILYQNCVNHEVSIMLMTPTQIHNFLQHKKKLLAISNLRILTTGEELTQSHVKQLKQLNSKVFNGLGRSESPIGVTLTECFTGEPINVGRAITGRQYRIINPITKKDVSPGEVGEMVYLCEGFRGYLNNKTETAAQIVIIDGKQWSLSGDLIAQLVNESSRSPIVDSKGFPITLYRGRKDRQLKIAGVRIEPIGIENALRENELVSKAHTIVIMPKKRGQMPKLVSFVSTTIDIHSLNQELKRKLRGRLINHTLIKLDENDERIYTKLESGKLNEEGLYKKYQQQIDNYAQNEISLTEQLIQYWRDIFAKDDITEASDFEALGGTSLDFATLIACMLSDDKIGLSHFTSEMTVEFSKNKTIENLVRIIHLCKERENLVHYYDNDRDATPVFIIGDFTQDDIKHISNSQPIIHIKSRSSEFNGDRNDDIIKTIRQCAPLGPYYLVSAHTESLAAITNKLATQNDQCHIFNINQSNELKQIYQAYFAERIKAKCTQYELDHKDHFRNQTMSDDSFSIYIDTQSISGSNIIDTLAHAGFSYEEIAILREKKVHLYFSGISTPDELKKTVSNESLQSFHDKQCTFVITAGLYGPEKYKPYVPVNSTLTYLRKTYAFDKERDIAIQLQEIYRQFIDTQLPLGSSKNKSKLFELIVSYGKALAAEMNKADVLPIQLAPSILEDEHARSTQLSRLLDMNDIDTQMAFAAQPLQFDENNFGFVDNTIKKFLLSSNTLANPYYGQVINESIDLQIDLISKKYHQEGGRTPLFFLPPITGDHSYDVMLQTGMFSADQPVYSFTDPKKTAIKGDYTSITALATFYVSLIEHICPKGPVKLAGWSFGGLVAYEIGLQLKSKGGEIGFLGLIDTPSPSYYQELIRNPDQHRKLLQARLMWLCDTYGIPIEANIFSKLTNKTIDCIDAANAVWQAFVSYVRSQKATIINLKGATYYNYIIEKINLSIEHYRMTLEYQTSDTQFDGMHLYCANTKHKNYEVINNQQLGWSSLQHQQVHIIDGSDHFTITQMQSYATELSRHINSICNTVTDKISLPLFSQKIESLTRETLARQQQFVPTLWISLESHYEKQIIKMDQIWDDEFLTNLDHHYIVLGEAGSGKSATLRKLYQQFAEKYLSNPGKITLPLFVNASDSIDCLNAKLEKLALTETQRSHFLHLNPVIFIDGIDEGNDQKICDTINHWQNINPGIRFILSCKTQYFDSRPNLSHYIYNKLKAKAVIISHVSDDEKKRYLDHYIPEGSTQLRSWLENYIERVVSSTTQLTPMYLHKLVTTAPIIGKQHDFALRLYTRAELYHQQMTYRAKLFDIEPAILKNFARKLTISLYFNHNATVNESGYAWDKVNSEFINLLTHNRLDTNKIKKALSLQSTQDRYTFSHHSDQEYFLATIILDELISSEFNPEESLLNKILLCYEHDVLNFIAELYHDYIFTENTHDEDTRRKSVITLLHHCVIQAKGNQKFKTLAANAMSLLAAFKDLKIDFPTDLSDVYFADMNLSGAILEGIDFRKAHSENALLSGAIIPTTTPLPTHWDTPHNSEQFSASNRIQTLERTCNNQVCRVNRTNSNGTINFERMNLSTGEGKLFPRLVLAGDEKLANARRVVRHPNGRFTAAISHWRNTTRDSTYQSDSFFWLQFFDGDDVLELLEDPKRIDPIREAANGKGHPWPEYMREAISNQNKAYPIPDQFPGMIGQIQFHPDPNKAVLFAISHPKYTHTASDKIFIFDPRQASFITLEDRQSMLHKFAVNQQMIINEYTLYDDEEPCTDITIGNSIQKLKDFGFKITDVNNYSKTQKLSLSELGIPLTGEIKDFTLSESHSVIVFYIKSDCGHHIYIYDFNNKKLEKIPLGKNECFSLAISVDESLTIAYALDKQIFLWEASKKRSKPIHEHHNSTGLQLMFSSTHLHIKSADGQRLDIVRYNDTTAGLSKFPQTHSSAIKNTFVHPTLSVVITLSEKQILYWDSRTCICLERIDRNAIKEACMTTVGDFIIFIEESHVYKLNIQSRKIHCVGNIPGEQISHLMLDATNESFLLLKNISNKDKIFRFDLTSGHSTIIRAPNHYTYNPLPHRGDYYHFALTDKIHSQYHIKHFTSLYYTVIENTNGDQVYRFGLRPHKRQAHLSILTTAISHDGQCIFISDYNGNIYQFELGEPLKFIRQFQLPEGNGISIQSLQQGWLFIGNNQGNIFVFDIADSSKNASQRLLFSTANNMEKRTEIPTDNRTYIATQSDQKSPIQIVNYKGDFVTNIYNHQQFVTNYQFSDILWNSQDHYFVAAYRNGEILFYNLTQSTQQICNLFNDDEYVIQIDWQDNRNSSQLALEIILKTNHGAKYWFDLAKFHTNKKPELVQIIKNNFIWQRGKLWSEVSFIDLKNRCRSAKPKQPRLQLPIHVIPQDITQSNQLTIIETTCGAQYVFSAHELHRNIDCDWESPFMTLVEVSSAKFSWQDGSELIFNIDEKSKIAIDIDGRYSLSYLSGKEIIKLQQSLYQVQADLTHSIDTSNLFYLIQSINVCQNNNKKIVITHNQVELLRKIHSTIKENGINLKLPPSGKPLSVYIDNNKLTIELIDGSTLRRHIYGIYENQLIEFNDTKPSEQLYQSESLTLNPDTRIVTCRIDNQITKQFYLPKGIPYNIEIIDADEYEVKIQDGRRYTYKLSDYPVAMPISMKPMSGEAEVCHSMQWDPQHKLVVLSDDVNQMRFKLPVGNPIAWYVVKDKVFITNSEGDCFYYQCDQEEIIYFYSVKGIALNYQDIEESFYFDNLKAILLFRSNCSWGLFRFDENAPKQYIEEDLAYTVFENPNGDRLYYPRGNHYDCKEYQCTKTEESKQNGQLLSAMSPHSFTANMSSSMTKQSQEQQEMPAVIADSYSIVL